MSIQDSLDSPHTPSGLVTVATVFGMLKAEILRAELENYGLDVLMDYESAGRLLGLTIEGLKLSQVRIMVPQAQAEQARQILDTPPEPGWEDQVELSDPDA